VGYTNVILDFDGTLVDSREDIAAAQLWVLGQFGAEALEKEQLYPHIGKTLQETFALFLPPEVHWRIPEAAELYSEYYPPRSLLTTRLFPGVRETLIELRRSGKRLAVASTKRVAGIRRVTDHFHIAEFFSQLQGSDGIPYKPDPFIVRKILSDQAWDRSETLMVGDSGHDMVAGRAAGVATCGVTYGALTAEQIRAFSPDFVIDRFPDLRLVLDRKPSGGTRHERALSR
jgi:phosphoglycolate phosphatase